VLQRFAKAMDPDVEGTALLEQYQAQIGILFSIHFHLHSRLT
jgi:hypothetical protein